ncbi:GTP binding protein Bms1 [Xylariaceae sp. FL1019]|nr:GTP binding protein Bms1 [Xylariaceae sp. FL1019]
MDDQAHKPHRKAKEKKKHVGDKNPKAFAFSNPGKLQRAAARSHDIREKRLHVPQVDRLPDTEPPPRLVAIVGPPGVGKTTLLKSLVKRYTKESLSEPTGPVTVITSRKQRLTFFECPNSLTAMVDVAKIADVVLLLIDGNFGFEMETMEFLNILTATGMPGNVFSILTHLDLFRKPQQLKDAKKRLKHRLWNELYQGAHLFYLSGVINGRYPDREIHNMSRFLSVMKNPRPLIFKNSHTYCLIDSFRDITHPTQKEEDENCDRTIALCGYLRGGVNFNKEHQRIHVPGVGDFTANHVEALPDPCPSPAQQQMVAKATGKTGRKRLDEKDKRLHAPFSDRSGLKIDGDAIFLTREKGFSFDKDAEGVERGLGEELIVSLQGERRLLGQTDDSIQLFRGGDRLVNAPSPEVEDTGRKSQRTARVIDQNDDQDHDVDGNDLSDDDHLASGVEEEGSDFDEDRLGTLFKEQSGEDGEDLAYADSDSDLGSDGDLEEDEAEDDDDDELNARWRTNLTEKAKALHGNRPSYRTADLAKLMYDQNLTAHEVLQRWKDEVEEENIEDDSEDDEFFKSKNKNNDEYSESTPVPKLSPDDYDQLAVKWSVEENIERLRQRFTSAGNRDKGDDDDGFGGFGDDNEDGDENDEEMEGWGEFEDLEADEKPETDQAEATETAEPAESLEAERARNAARKEELRLRFEEEDRDGKANGRDPHGEEFGEDDWYESQKAAMQKQLDINKAEFEGLDERQRLTVEGYQAGTYVRVVLDRVPAELVANFDAHKPMVLGGLSALEERFGFSQVRLRKHRWHKRILKNNDPLIFSAGWRRFQAIPTLHSWEERVRHRMLKYSPEHSFCYATFHGPLVSPNSSFVCFQSFSSENPGFRIAATGTILSVDSSTEIVKKLKLTGSPAKVYKNTAFIKDMFTSSLEIAKFEGASIKTVSGIRGQIKRALSKPEGHFRATFEDKILMGDLVFLRAWYPVKPRRFYNPVTDLLGEWQPMRLTGEVRRDQGIATPQLADSKYRPIERTTRHFNPLRVPRQLAADLPFKSQIVRTKPQKKTTYMQKRAVVLGGEEKRARDLMQKLTTIRKDTVAKRRAKKEEKRVEYRKKLADAGEKKEAREKREKQEYWKREGKKRKGDVEGGGGKRRR